MHKHGPLLEENSYYPFGLQMAGISSKAANSLENKYKFNGGTELNNDLGFGIYETPLRGYDAQIGRFQQSSDPLAASYSGFSCYAFVGNNPVLFSDPSGARIALQSPQMLEEKEINIDVDPGDEDKIKYFTTKSLPNMGIQSTENTCVSTCFSWLDKVLADGSKDEDYFNLQYDNKHSSDIENNGVALTNLKDFVLSNFLIEENCSTIINSIDYGYPVLLGLKTDENNISYKKSDGQPIGHCVVAVGYKIENNDINILYRDPSEGLELHQSMNQLNTNGVFYILTIGAPQ